VRQDLANSVALRGGEYLLQCYCPRPLFYFVALEAITDLIQGSAVQQVFPAADTSLIGIHNYILHSAKHHSHAQSFPTYSATRQIMVNLRQ
jgi:hypothetical protein